VLLLASLALLVVTAGAAGALSFGWNSQSGAGQPGAAGRLVVTQPTVDLGRVPFDRPAEARFDLTNTGGGTVRLVGAPRVRMLEGC
jgi:hypothetical protein